jgi:cellobiose phosphorylase
MKGQEKISTWKFTGESNAEFISENPYSNSRLFFPLFNRAGMKCSVTPELKGDICSSFHSYHSTPVVTEDFHRVLNGRYFWIYTDKSRPWSIAGRSIFEKTSIWDNQEKIKTQIEGKIGSFKVIKTNPGLHLKATTTVFVPFNEDFVEISIVEIENTGQTPVTCTPTSAVPIYARSADNLRDHRNVTSMFNRIFVVEHGVQVKPLINFNEFGHSDNDTSYYSVGFKGDGEAPVNIWCTMRDFIGEGGSMDNPRAVFRNLQAPELKENQRHGYEAVGALGFNEVTIQPGEKKSYIIINGISETKDIAKKWKEKYGTITKAREHLQNTLDGWESLVNRVSFKSHSTEFDNWTKWINFQLFCRQVYGNSYLPDFGYGRGGRGWRDLWSDLLAIFLVHPESAVDEMINNFRGIRIDGTNATIIGTRPGEFIADRNNVPRTWCDHGVWPVFVLNFYIQQTGDFNILWKNISYWKDVFSHRSKKRDELWEASYGHHQKDENGNIYEGSIFEHVLLQQLASFYNVGDHNIMLLEGADWNDTYDMARQNGESVCFNNWVAGNFKTLASLLKHTEQNGSTKISLLSEIVILLDTLNDNQKYNYDSVTYKQDILNKYYQNIQHNVSGNKIEIDINLLINDLETKAEFLFNHIRSQEWLTVSEGNSFFNGHYDNNRNKVHGDHPKGVRIDLTSQVLPTIFKVATDEQIPQMYQSISKYLHNKKVGGLHLCSDFKEDRLYFGRITGFSYGHKEHGGIWMQQNVMYMYGLYLRNFVREGYQVYCDIYKLCNTSETAKTYPGIPSYFEPDGHGSYMYLTGSATWLTLTLVTQMYGIRGENGNLLINPKLTKEQFFETDSLILFCNFQEFTIEVSYQNKNKKEWNMYSIKEVQVNGKTTEICQPTGNKAIISMEKLVDIFDKSKTNKILVILN